MERVRAIWKNVAAALHDLGQGRAMRSVRAALGYAVAALTIPLMMAAIFSLEGGIDEAVVAATGLAIAPGLNGGEVVRTVDRGAYQTQVHEMVFEALIGERERGFVQVVWTPLDALPARIDEEIDADGDGQADFRVELDTQSQQATLTPYAEWVLELEGVYPLSDALALRATLRNPSR